MKKSFIVNTLSFFTMFIALILCSTSFGLSDAGTSWLTYGDKGDYQKGGNLKIVRKDGLGDFISIQSAIDSITDASTTNTYTILVYPDIYDEKVTLKNYISLIGTDRKSCKIISAQTWDGKSAVTGYVVKVTNGELSNLYIENTRSSYPSVAVYISGEGNINNCDIISNQADTLCVLGGRVENCYIHGSDDTICLLGNVILKNILQDNGTQTGVSLWWGWGAGVAQLYDCTFKSSGTIPNIQIENDVNYKAYFFNCKFLKSDDTPNQMIYNGAYGAHSTIYLSGCVYSSKGEPACTYVEIKQGDQNFNSVQVGGTECISSSRIGNFYSLKINGTERISTTGLFTGNGSKLTNVNADQLDGKHLGASGSAIPSCDTANVIWVYNHTFNGAISAVTGQLGSLYCRYGTGSPLKSGLRWVNGTDKLEFSDGDNWDTNLYRSAANILKTDDTFQSLKQQSTESRWKYYSAVGWAKPYVSYDVHQLLANSVNNTPTWHTNANAGATHLHCTVNAVDLNFPVNYESGTTLSGLAVKFQVEGKNDGVKISLLKRKEDEILTEWIQIADPYIITETDKNVHSIQMAINPDEAMLDNYSYVLKVESVVATTGVKLYAVGLQTANRVF